MNLLGGSKPSKSSASMSVDLKEMFSGTSVKFRNMNGAKKFFNQNKHKPFAKLTKKIMFDTWLGLKMPSESDLKKYNAEIKAQSERIMSMLTDENGLIISPSGIKLTTEGVLPEEFVRQYFNIIYCDKLLGKDPSIKDPRDEKFRNICGAYWLSFLENIDYEGSYETAYSNVKEHDVVIDIGGGYGFFALVALKQGADKVYVFEPNDKARAIILKNRELNGYTQEQMPVYKNALGAKHVEKAILYSDKKTLCSGVIRTLNADMALNNKKVEQITKVITFDEFYRSIDTEKVDFKVDFIKINTNGNESDVVRGMSYFMTYSQQDPDVVATICFGAEDELKIRQEISHISNAYVYSKRMAKLHAYKEAF